MTRPGKASMLAALGLLAITALPRLPLGPAGGRWESPLPVVILGTVIGLTYGLLSVGLVLIYRTSRVINFAHGEIGAFAAALFGLVVNRWRIPYWIGLPVLLAVGAGVAALAEVAVIRRLRNAPRLMSVVATLGIGQLLVLSALALNAEAGVGALFPEPPGVPTFAVGTLQITPAYSAMLLLCPVVVFLLASFLKRSRHGLAMRAVAANREVARMSGIHVGRMSSLAWGLAGALSALTAILNQPSQALTVGGTFGPSLLLRALVGAVVARMTSMGVAFAVGIGLGVLEQLLLWNYSDPGLVSVVVLIVVLVGLLALRPLAAHGEERGTWAAVDALRPLPDALRQLWLVRNLGRLVGTVLFVLAGTLLLFVSNTTAVTLTGMCAYAIVGLSIGVITGLGGQLTLGQFALAAVGGVASLSVAALTGNFTLSFLCAGIGAALASVVIGLPALRMKGPVLVVTTLSFVVMTSTWLLEQPWMLGPGREVPRPVFFGEELATGRSYYALGLIVLLSMMVLAHNVRRGGLGRMLVGIRDNEQAARAFSVPPTATMIWALLVSGFMAGVGGALYIHSLSQASSSSFPIQASIVVVVSTIVGGISLLAGPVLGVLLVIAVPTFVPLDAAALAATHLGLLMIILYLPAGLGGLVEPVRDAIVAWAARRAGLEPGEQTESSRNRAPALAGARLQPFADSRDRRYRLVNSEPLLQVVGIHKRFDGVRAVSGVSLDVYPGETAGLIGPNGAGKTTILQLIGGFASLDAGTVAFDGRDVSWMTAEQRARLGIIRSFQDAALFPTMTVEDVVLLALERVSPTSLLASTLGFPGNERAKRERAGEIISFMGLVGFRHKQIRELSTGTRRITELACVVALEPTLLLLDEPSAGIARAEADLLGNLLSRLKDELDMTLLVVEHDIDLITDLSDRVIAVADGEVLVSGDPSVVRQDRRVIAAYVRRSVEASGGPGPHP